MRLINSFNSILKTYLTFTKVFLRMNLIFLSIQTLQTDQILKFF